MLDGTSTVIGIRQAEVPADEINFYNGTDYIRIADREANVWKDYRIEVYGTMAKIYVNQEFVLETSISERNVDIIKFWALGSGNQSDSWYDNVYIYKLQ